LSDIPYYYKGLTQRQCRILRKTFRNARLLPELKISMLYNIREALSRQYREESVFIMGSNQVQLSGL